MRSGSLRSRVILQQPSGTRDALGERTTVWTNVATVFARIRPLTAQEMFATAQRMSSVSHVVEIRYSAVVSVVTAGWRIAFGSRVFVIDGIINPEEGNIKLMLYCTEGLRDE